MNQKYQLDDVPDSSSCRVIIIPNDTESRKALFIKQTCGVLFKVEQSVTLPPW